MNLQFFPTALIAAILATTFPARTHAESDAAADLHKVEDIVIYQNETFYSAFPSIVRRPDGELIVAFRRAPERRALGEKRTTHTDPNSYLVLVRSRDGGKSWSKEPELIYANPFGGSQDPCMVQLRDGTMVCTSYGWALVQPEVASQLNDSLRHGNFAFLGGYVLQSKDGGHSWRGPFYPPPVGADRTVDVLRKPVPAYNRGAMCQGKDGRLYWVVAANTDTNPRRTENHLLISTDKGETWTYSCPVAADPNITFNEASLYETPKGNLVAFIRTANFDDHTVVARSTDGGRSFQPWQDSGFQGHPHFALRLPDKRVLLVYGYRHAPFGIRARVLNAECTDCTTAKEMILRNDGGNGDLGYPWAAMISRNRALVVYYFNIGDSTRHIAGSVLEVGR
jgi:hypothetical protein